MRWYQHTGWWPSRRSFLLPVILFLVLVAFLPGATAAESDDLRSLSIEELMEIEVQTVSSASKYLQKTTEAPSAVSVITAEDIRIFGYRTLADILASVRGIAATYDRVSRSAGIRGFGRLADRTTGLLLLVDGHRLNDSVYFGVSMGSDFILDVDLIERVEVSRGPGSSLYGSNAFFAVVNIVTRRGQGLRGGEISAEAGSSRTGKGRVSYGARDEHGSELLLSGSAGESRGDRLYFREFDPADPFFDPRAANGGYDEYHDSDSFRSAFFSVTGRGLTLSGAWNSRAKDVPTAANGSDFNTSGNRIEDRRGYLDLRFEHAAGSGLDVTARVYYDTMQHEAVRIYSGVTNKDVSAGTRAGGEVTLGARLSGRHHVVAGAEYTGNHRQDQRNSDEVPFAQYFDDERRSRAWAVYLQDEIAVSPFLMMNAGVRYDDAGTGGSIASPRFAAILNSSAGSTVKLLYGGAFRSPSVYERYYQAPASFPPLAANPNLKPEKIRTYELVYERTLGSGLHATVDGYLYRISDLIDQSIDAAGNLTFRNVEQAEGRGLEIELAKRLAGGSRARFSYAVQEVVDARTDVLLANAPRHLAKLNLAVPLLQGALTAGIEEQYTGRRKTGGDAWTEDVFLTNLTVTGRAGARAIELSLGIYNLFDAAYGDPVSRDLLPLDAVSQDGRTVRLKATYAF